MTKFRSWDAAAEKPSKAGPIVLLIVAIVAAIILISVVASNSSPGEVRKAMADTTKIAKDSVTPTVTPDVVVNTPKPPKKVRRK